MSVTDEPRPSRPCRRCGGTEWLMVNEHSQTADSGSRTWSAQTEWRCDTCKTSTVAVGMGASETVWLEDTDL